MTTLQALIALGLLLLIELSVLFALDPLDRRRSVATRRHASERTDA